MPVDILVGLQYGDEGKGRVIDSLAPQYDIVARFCGGNNAGHTVKYGDINLKLNMIPSGIVHEDILNLIGRGCIINPAELCAEIQRVQLALGRPITYKQLLISKNCHIITDEYIELDHKHSQKRIGTTGRGIGPTYSKKHARESKRLIDVIEQYPMLQMYMGDAEDEVMKALEYHKNILCEGAQGTFLDIDHGQYPYVTSCNTLASHACTTLGFGMNQVRDVIGVFKAYTTRVGEGHLEGEWSAQDAQYESIFKSEIGTTTGRQRRCAPLNLPQLEKSVFMNGVTKLVMTKVDLLTGSNFPVISDGAWDGMNIMKGWKDPNAADKNFSDFLKYIEEATGVKLWAVSNGPNREEYSFNHWSEHSVVK